MLSLFHWHSYLRYLPSCGLLHFTCFLTSLFTLLLPLDALLGFASIAPLHDLGIAGNICNRSNYNFAETANAFVLPGGKVFVHSGILNVCRSEDALAAVLGHEVAHNTASHAAERLSTYWVGMLTGGSLFFLAGAAPGLALFGIWSFVGGFYLQDLLFNLPMGRQQESEADYIGLMMMAEACYDPQAAMVFWKRMEKMAQQGGQQVPEMLSTHPSNEHRIAKIALWMPEAIKKREQSECRITAAFADKFRQTLRGPLV